MSEEAAIAAIALAIAGSTGVLAFKLGRRLRIRYPDRWAVKLPLYFAGYHICWVILSVVLVPAFGIGKGIFILNPIYALALKNTRVFEGVFATVLPTIGSPLANIIVLIIAVVVFSTGLWIISGLILGAILDSLRWRTPNYGKKPC